MDLFPPGPHENRLPCDGTVQYFGKVLTDSEAGTLMETLLHHVPWRRDEIVMFGRRVATAREAAWYGDPGTSYTYSGATKQPIPWNAPLMELKPRVESLCNARFNSCLLNLYHNGTEGMGWHSDDEKELGPNPIIASVSLGAERRFCFKHKRTGERMEIVLEHGSLLVMKDQTQANWLHSLPKAAKVTGARINLTFRTISSPR
jgi:alkylated DNA repair dioxygenase AlkB